MEHILQITYLLRDLFLEYIKFKLNVKKINNVMGKNLNILPRKLYGWQINT